MNVNVFQNISMTSHVAAFYLLLSLRFSTAVIFVMDSSNAERMAEAHDEAGQTDGREETQRRATPGVCQQTGIADYTRFSYILKVYIIRSKNRYTCTENIDTVFRPIKQAYTPVSVPFNRHIRHSRNYGRTGYDYPNVPRRQCYKY